MDAVYATRVLIRYCSLFRQVQVSGSTEPSSYNVHTSFENCCTHNGSVVVIGSITFSTMRY
jgi:hypothetical protein